ncbi:glycosyltransferase [uncultured Paracoccus sp.]|uniref:glycosyltransferase n=1 Tax=uncultured Paracoccus sp. TaxID=189685 RepID=UPI00260E88AB|nr:glycosyltransferase [uncultured Paracoccus sp.]
MPSLDIVICTYNRAADLDRCLDALARQETAAGNWRVTVIDNNCTDRTAEVVAAHARRGRIPHLTRRVERRQGLTPARQAGVRDSRADWIAFVDDDCLVGSTWIAAALEFAASRPDAGGFGGRVRPDWGRSPPDYLARHAWLFAAQDHGDQVRRVESLVGAGIVLNRRALGDTGWTAEPYLADRTGLGHVSGGDVEICLRVTAAGRPLWYVPTMHIDHMIARERQRMGDLVRLARGLGAGAELVSLMGSPDPASWPQQTGAILRREVRVHLASTSYVLRGRYPWQDWLIRMAFLSGQRAQHRSLTHDARTRDRLGGVGAR